jgi:DNA-binding MarR family transcriptional regulator
VTDFEASLNDLLVATFDTILKFESESLRQIAGVSVTISEAHMLAYIAEQDGKATVSQIAANRWLAVPTVTIAVKKLEKKGYVAKAPSPVDGRRVYIRLTEQGERINRAHTILHQRMVRNISNQFQPNEKDILLSAIKKLNTFFSGLTGGQK